MRVIAGDYKGRRLFPPADMRVRPTSDKVKEAIFSMAAPWLPGAVAVDLFAGSGNLGIEALSRGAELVYFADNSRESVALVRKNLAHCRAGEKARILQGDWERALERIEGPVDLFLLDPPYEAGILESCLAKICESGLLAEDGLIVAEHSASRPIVLEPENSAGGLEIIREKRYGTIGIALLQKAGKDRTE